MQTTPPRPARAIGVWLLVVAAFVLAMIIVGGLTRLSRSGLSIVEWKPLTGVLPPLGDAAWAAEYAKYQASPEGRLVNAGMPMDAFQRIFYVEWAHRLLGRLTGLVVLVPLLFFAARRQLQRRRLLALLGIFVLGGLQGLAGWLMVKSGLVDAPRVSHFRLTIHLLLALLCLSLLLWMALDVLVPPVQRARARALSRLAVASIVVVTLAITWGGLMAGSHAGLAAPTFPTMNGAWIPAWIEPSLGVWRSATEGLLGIHFVHRALAYLATVVVLWTAAAALRSDVPRLARAAAFGMMGHVVVQVVLGAVTVWTHVPMAWASLHQLNGALLLGVCVVFLYGVRRA